MAVNEAGLLKVFYAVGMEDRSVGFIDRDLKAITPPDTIYGSGEVTNINGEYYIIMQNRLLQQ